MNADDVTATAKRQLDAGTSEVPPLARKKLTGDDDDSASLVSCALCSKLACRRYSRFAFNTRSVESIIYVCKACRQLPTTVNGSKALLECTACLESLEWGNEAYAHLGLLYCDNCAYRCAKCLSTFLEDDGPSISSSEQDDRFCERCAERCEFCHYAVFRKSDQTVKGCGLFIHEACIQDAKLKLAERK